MSRKSFTDPAATETTETTELAVQTAAPVIAFAKSDIEIPRMQVVQKMSELDIDAPIGAIVHNKEFILYRPGVKVPSIVLFAQKYWKEDVPFDSDYMPEFVHTEEDAEALRTRNGRDGYPIISAANIALLVAHTEDALSDEAFQFELDGRRYALGKFTVQKKSYDTTYKALASFMLFNPKVDPSAIHWNLSSFSVTKGKYSWFVPSITPVPKDPIGPEAAEFTARFKA